MLLGFLLFESQFIHVVAITFTALIFTELLMVALTLRTWHGLMLLAQFFSIIVYILSLLILKDHFGMREGREGEGKEGREGRGEEGREEKSVYFVLNLPFPLPPHPQRPLSMGEGRVGEGRGRKEGERKCLLCPQVLLV